MRHEMGRHKWKPYREAIPGNMQREKKGGDELAGEAVIPVRLAERLWHPTVDEIHRRERRDPLRCASHQRG
jgi:hypothetical protein